MEYHYEALDEHNFQKLSQALIVSDHPNAQCLPIAQPDGGRDAILHDLSQSKRDFIVFQVKYSRNPSNKTEREIIESTLASETPKVANLIDQGATKYYLITNVRGTAHPNSGSIDKAHAQLTASLGIPAFVWWRDDIDRRLDSNPNIKWTYPEILRATEILPMLLHRLDENNEQATRAFQSYMGVQWQHDREIKFKQVELKRSLADLFVDIPIALKRPLDDRDRRHGPSRLDFGDELALHLSKLDVDHSSTEQNGTEDGSRLAAAFLLQTPLTQGVSRFVIEGAPGQGKSTVTQFVCQVNRLRLLKKTHDLKRVDKLHVSGPVRIPFRLDLRDYAAWTSGRNPFPKNPNIPDAPTNGSLESFLAAQVTSTAETLWTTPDQLLQFLRNSQSILVLDGFDEVADIPTRIRIVDEICNASARLEAQSCSTLIVVTSRPAVFANSPGFPEDDWIHLKLQDLRDANILSYRDKWAHAQELTPQERTMVSRTLETKLEQPHLRDLARNPMQLSILLHLIHVQGSALPEKRTTLYEEYMKLFFNREAEKSDIVRDHRELILSIHGLLAWRLHTEAEEGTGSGSITRQDLRSSVKNYLESEEHNPNLVDPLLTGTVERVGALVSRVQGTFEFEVQPLREYFAARHLYTTAPYSPSGKGAQGTKPDRLDALVRSSYWTNVTRFFCGFFDVGELGTLVDGLVHMDESDDYHLVNQPRRLSLMLLADHVFAQSPRTMRRLIAHVTREPEFYRLTATEAPFGDREISLPETAGRHLLFAACSEKLLSEDDPEHQRTLREVMRANADESTLITLWRNRLHEGSTSIHPLREASDFRILSHLSPREFEMSTKEDVSARVHWLSYAGNNDIIVNDKELYIVACRTFFDGDLSFYRSPTERNWNVLEILSMLLNTHALPHIWSANTKVGTMASVMSRFFSFDAPELLRNVGEYLDTEDRDTVTLFAHFLINHMQSDVGEWRAGLEAWSTLVDRGLNLGLGSLRFEQISAISTAVRSEEIGRWSDECFSASCGLVERLYFARKKHDDLLWWRGQLASVGDEQKVLALSVFLSWSDGEAIVGLKPEVEAMVDGLAEEDWSRLRWLIGCVASARDTDVAVLTNDIFRRAGGFSRRLWVALIDRISDMIVKRQCSREAFGDYEGSDQWVIQTAANNELVPEEDEGGGVDWEYLGRLSKVGRKAALPYLFSVHWPRHDWKIPEDFAKQVLRESREHCAQLVVMCERSYSARVAERADSLWRVAERDGWFCAEESLGE